MNYWGLDTIDGIFLISQKDIESIGKTQNNIYYITRFDLYAWEMYDI